MPTRCKKCGRPYHKTAQQREFYSAFDERMIEGLALRGFNARQIAQTLNELHIEKGEPGCVRTTQNIREKARHMGLKLVPAINWRNQHGSN